MPRHHAILVCLALALALAATGCGGGGGGGGLPPADESLLSGDYFMLILAGDDDTPDDGTALWGDVALDGAGVMTGSYTENGGGGISGPSVLPAAMYTVAASRATSLSLGSLGYSGWTGADGGCSLMGDVLGSTPSTLALCKLGSGFNQASLNGEYHVAGFLVSLAGDSEGYAGTATFDGAGTATFNVTKNLEGTISALPAEAATYLVSANGRFQVTFTSGGDVHEGAIVPGGGLALMGGSTTPGGTPGAFALVPKTAGASSSTLSGSYQLVGLERDGGGFTSLTGEVSADGTSTITANFTRNTDGTITTSGPDITDYTVAADGTVTVDTTTDMLQGGVSGDGRYAILGGPTASTSSPSFYLLLRR